MIREVKEVPSVIIESEDKVAHFSSSDGVDHFEQSQHFGVAMTVFAHRNDDLHEATLQRPMG